MRFIKACFNEEQIMPIWLMRQAGRYLPEYMQVRNLAGDFLSLCKDYKKASEVTIQPITRFDFDAAIIFSDILVVPNEMGLSLEFQAGEGPVFNDVITDINDVNKLDLNAANKLTYVYDAIKLTRDTLAKDKALIGFCGAPWTLATYMIEAKGSKTYTKSKKMLYQNPELMHSLLERISIVLCEYLQKQIDAGANAIQIFDSWASALEPSAYLEFSWAYIEKIAKSLKQKNPSIPIIAFPKGVGGFIECLNTAYIDVLGIDWSTPLQLAFKKDCVLQGNLEPCRLYSKQAIKDGVLAIKNALKEQNKAHIFNLGHGILPDIPIENVHYLIEQVRNA
ncbi:uroporphyrinogen decarboxylase [Campylobacter canadensis]|uniref:Uroporphyrinogen decarboxylase n=1 Tax=Campylobacter canadensis TaxID=449520 RepID=A0ABS7WQN7_9BACT|nr:uroporphyrinogen decarboxylase [Campylobacter canadensis]MBZ7987070.1 uroporphyrinogen decarboxylase [Campylobacter canadensis]MBZ7994684.1 uroporphyrinogen decarboxylase [Campylobacter canadensis]MBZ7996180.1 uroporphyrinogen decarboxylase [Campylobacter canadensis]MBZ7998106.1 uroporphyrinogen decarboxylase [Campylobacter canadensis]MBZ8000004.1 uroporphyrinogen decarboxylase [Campylobacter canadensis]